MTFRAASELVLHPELMEPPQVVAAPCGVAGRVTLLTLGPKGGKSTTAAGIIAGASREGVRCALLTVDEAKADSLQRFPRFGAVLDLVYLDDQFEPAELEEQLSALGVDLLVVDHLGKIAESHPDFGPGSQGDSVLWGRLVSPFTALARSLDIAVILLDQARRSDGKWAGSVGKGGNVDIMVELVEKNGGLEATPKGRVPLPPFRVELDPNGVPQFSGATVTASGSAVAPDGRSLELLQHLSDSEPEGLTSGGWEKISGLPKTSYNRNRKILLRDGLAIGPDQTRTKRYRITEKGEKALLVPEVPNGATGTTALLGRNGANGAKPYVIGLARGTSQAIPPDFEETEERHSIQMESVV